MHPNYKYFGFGLCIQSQMEFPEFLPSSFEQEDIRIIIGRIPQKFDTYPDYNIVFSDVSEEIYYLNIPGVARYFVTNGKLVIIDPYSNSEEKTIRMFFLSSVMAALLVQRNQILLHASAIIHNDKLVLFIGSSGAGKSSIAAEMTKRGYSLFSDDICVLNTGTDDDKPMTVYASYPMMKLWKKTIHALEDNRFSTSHKIRPNADKFGYFFHDIFKTKPLPVKKIFLLNPNPEQKGYESKKISGIEAFEWLSKNTYRAQFILDNKIQAIHFESISQLIRKTEMLMISRPLDEGDIKSFTDYTEKLI